MCDERRATGSRRFLLLVTVIIGSQVAVGVALPIDAVLGIDRFTGISFAGLPRTLLAFLASMAALSVPLITRRWITPRTTGRERSLVFVTAAVGGFVTFYVWKAAMAALIRSEPTLVPVAIFGVAVGLLSVFRRFRKDEQVSREREEWFERSRITRNDLRRPRRIVADRYKLGYVTSFAFYLVVFVCSGAVFLTSATNGTLSSTIMALGSGVVCFQFGGGLYGLVRHQPR